MSNPFMELNRKHTSSIGDFSQYITKVQIWGYNKGILKPVRDESEMYKIAMSQCSKTISEVSELVQALNIQSPEHIYDAYGDIMVTLIMGMEALRVSPVGALSSVYDIISKRTGKMVDGIFVKDE